MRAVRCLKRPKTAPAKRLSSETVFRRGASGRVLRHKAPRTPPIWPLGDLYAFQGTSNGPNSLAAAQETPQ
jgi:hypothetical protein